MGKSLNLFRQERSAQRIKFLNYWEKTFKDVDSP